MQPITVYGIETMIFMIIPPSFDNACSLLPFTVLKQFLCLLGGGKQNNACSLLPFTVLKLLILGVAYNFSKNACNLLPFTVLKLGRVDALNLLLAMHAAYYRLRY